MRSIGEVLRLHRSLLPKIIRLRNRHFLLLDFAVLCVSPLLSLALLIDGKGNMSTYLSAIYFYTLGALIVRLIVFYACGLYRRYWRSATAEDLVQLVFASVLATILTSLLFFIGFWTGSMRPEMPRFLPVLDGILTLGAVGATRFSLRIARRTYNFGDTVNVRSALIIGAGLVGERIVRELRASPRLGLKPIGFLDDDVHKHGLGIQGIPVLGSRQQLPRIVRERDVSQVIIALPNVSGKVIRETLALCDGAGVQARTVPSLSQILSEKVRVSELRKIDIEDVLRRDPIETNIDAVSSLIKGQRVLITGAGGSIGSEICRQILACGPTEIGLLGHGENSIFEIHNELLSLSKQNVSTYVDGRAPVLHPIIADIRSAVRLNRIIADFRPHIVLHAAAHKHVPLMQENPTEAVSNNILGTKNLVDAALASGVEHLVMISTDKVVNPTSIMGVSKRIAEMVVLQAARNSGRHYVAVRFGNVLGSRGSVVPTFKQQIASGGPVTVSHPEMTRYFITIPEAVQLVLQAAVLGEGGEIFMLDMGEPVAIVDLARDLIELSGLEVGRDIDIVFTGIRPGEKLCEELFVRGEVYEPTKHAKIRIVKNAGSFVSESLDETVSEFIRSVDEDDAEVAMDAFRALVPAFMPTRVRNLVNGATHAVAAAVLSELSELSEQRAAQDDTRRQVFAK